jgi:transposase
MMTESTSQHKCPNCVRLSQEVQDLKARVAALETELAKARKHSGNSSKPPSSDIVKPPPPAAKGRKRRKRRRGGQPGHTRHTRTPYPPEQVDHGWLYEWTESLLGPQWEPLEEFRTIQQVDLAPKLFEVTEHYARLYRHRETGKIVAAPFPKEVTEAGLIGPRLSALIAYQKGACHMTYSVIQRFLDDVFNLPVSIGQLGKVIRKASAALKFSHEQLQTALPGRRVLNVDETGHPECGKKLWTWGFHAPGVEGFTWFHIDPSRSSQVLKEFLGETFQGVVGCDYLSAYRKFLRETEAVLQFCWAHLIRDVKFLTTLSDRVTRAFGERLLEKIRGLFRVWHRRGDTPAQRWLRAAERMRQEVLKVVRRPPPRSEAQNIAERFRQHGRYYFTFLQEPGVEPTNNAMEQQFRFVVIDRKITQGTRGEPGRRWCERMWTVLATCAQQSRSAFHFIQQSILAYFTDATPPSLLPLPP